MRALASGILVALAAVFTLPPTGAPADTLDAPAESMAQPDGSFSFNVTFHKGPGSDRLAGYSWVGLENISGGPFYADCFCESFCPMFNPGDTFTFQVSGQLADPGAQGRLSANLSLCTSPGASATTVIRPYSATGAPVSEGDARFWNEPNPFSTRTTFHYRLAESGLVTLAIYDLAGRLIARVVDGAQLAGPQEATWDVRAHPEIRHAGGVLFARLAIPGLVRTRPLILTR
jgi:hypothetical protein